MAMERMMTMDEAAIMMGISGSCVRGRVCRNLIPVVRFKQSVLIRLADIVDIMDREADTYPEDLSFFVHPERFLDSHAAAGMLHISMQTLHVWKKVRIRPWGRIDGKLYFYRSEIETLRDDLESRGILQPKKTYRKRPSSTNKTCYHLVGREVQITAKCPFCHKEHSVKVPEGSSRWIYCREHEYMRYKRMPQTLRVRGEISLYGGNS